MTARYAAAVAGLDHLVDAEAVEHWRQIRAWIPPSSRVDALDAAAAALSARHPHHAAGRAARHGFDRATGALVCWLEGWEAAQDARAGTPG